MGSACSRTTTAPTSVSGAVAVAVYAAKACEVAQVEQNDPRYWWETYSVSITQHQKQRLREDKWHRYFAPGTFTAHFKDEVGPHYVVYYKKKEG